MIVLEGGFAAIPTQGCQNFHQNFKERFQKITPYKSYLFACQRVRVFFTSSQRTNATNIISYMITCTPDP